MGVESVERIGGLPAPFQPSPSGMNTSGETVDAAALHGRCLRCGGEFPGDVAACPRCAIPLVRLAPRSAGTLPALSASARSPLAPTGEEEITPFDPDALDDEPALEVDDTATGVEVRRRGDTIFVGYVARQRRSPVQLTVHDLLLPLGVVALTLGWRALESWLGRVVLGALLASLALVPMVRSPSAAAAPGMRQGFGGFQAFGDAGGRSPRPDGSFSGGSTSSGSTTSASTQPTASGALAPAATLVASQNPVADLLAGAPVSLSLARSGQWVRAGDRIRLDPAGGAEAATARPAIDETQAAERERRVLAGEFQRVEPFSTQLVVARHLAPPDPGASPAAGGTSSVDVVLESRPAWVVTLLAQDPIAGANRSFLSLFPQLEVAVIDAQSGQALLRTPPLPLPALNRAFPRPPLSPSSDPTRPLGYFGDAAP